MTPPTHQDYLARWAHIFALAKNSSPSQTWAKSLRLWKEWLELLLASKVKSRLPDHLRPLVESELKWAIADFNYLKTFIYEPPVDALDPPDAKNHPFVHLILEKRARRKPKTGGATGSAPPVAAE